MKDYTILQTSKIEISFAWYDLWIGVFIDTNKKRIYICPIPTLLITISY